MAVTLTEKAESRQTTRGANDTETLLYSARGSDNEGEVYEAVISGTPAMVNGLVRQSVTLRPVGDDNSWVVDVEYGARGENGTGNPLGVPASDPSASTGSEPGSDGEQPSTSPLGPGYTFDISAETVHILQSRKTFGPLFGPMDSFVKGTDLNPGAAANEGISVTLAAQPNLVGRTVRLFGEATGWRAGDYVVVAVNTETSVITFNTPCTPEGFAANGERWAMQMKRLGKKSGSALALTPGGAQPNAVVPDPEGNLVSRKDVGRTLWIKSGPPGWRPGPYIIRLVSFDPSPAWILDRPAAKAGSAGGATWVIPGAPLPIFTRKYDHKGAIGVNADRIEGCDILRSKFEWTRTIQVANLSRAYMLALRNLVGKKNREPFYGSKAGDVLYIGATGTFSVSDRWSVTHRFAEIEGQEDVEIIPGDGALIEGDFVVPDLSIPYKRGWDYLWVQYERRPSGGTIASRPVAAYVEEVYEDGDFSLIGIGV
jgi:hypothetical protein